MEEAVEDDELGRHDVEGGVLVERQKEVDPTLPQLGDGEPQHGQEHEHAGEVETLACVTQYEYRYIGALKDDLYLSALIMVFDGRGGMKYRHFMCTQHIFEEEIKFFSPCNNH